MYRLSETLESGWEHPETKRQRLESEMAVKLECDDANDAYAFTQPAVSANAPAPALSLAMPDAQLTTLATPPVLPLPVYVDLYYTLKHP